ncbi:MAG: hypothetical protein M3460_28775 [Actinomycetota bacterium]|nr:hypothetical protein [Actinomycetota bacterium]
MTVAVGENPVLEALAQWAAMVAATSQTDVNQLSAWARLRGTVGYQPLYVLVWRGSDLVAGAQIYIGASSSPPEGAMDISFELLSRGFRPFLRRRALRVQCVSISGSTRRRCGVAWSKRLRT